jgi:superfamily II DNA helicase RecQ
LIIYLERGPLDLLPNAACRLLYDEQTQPGPMSDEYDSGDDLLEDLNPDDFVGEKRAAPEDDGEHDPPSKRAKQEGADGPTNPVALARGLLRDKFGYDSFRHEQEKAIESVLRCNNTLVIFPTGGGKSLCYQVGTKFH